MTNDVCMIFIMLITQNCDFLLIWNGKTNPGVTVRSRWENSSFDVPPASLPDVITHSLSCAKTSKPSRLKLWAQWQMVKHRSPVKWHGCHLVGGLHRDWCSSDLWYFSWSHVESVPRRAMWIYFLRVMWNTYVPLISDSSLWPYQLENALISKPLWLYPLKRTCLSWTFGVFFVLIADSVRRSLLNRLHENAHVFYFSRQKHTGSWRPTAVWVN